MSNRTQRRAQARATKTKTKRRCGVPVPVPGLVCPNDGANFCRGCDEHVARCAQCGRFEHLGWKHEAWWYVADFRGWRLIDMDDSDPEGDLIPAETLCRECFAVDVGWLGYWEPVFGEAWWRDED